MGYSFRNSDKWYLDIKEDTSLTDEDINSIVERIKTLDRIQIKVT